MKHRITYAGWGLASLMIVSTSFAAPPSNLITTNPHTSKEVLAKAPGSYLSLDEAIRIGLAQHPLLERSRYTSQVVQAITKQIKGERYPWIEASVAGGSGSLRIISADGKLIHDRGGHGFDPGGALPKNNQNMITGGLILNQLITDFGFTAHRLLASQASETATQKDILTNKALVILKVQQAYLNCLMEQKLLEVSQATLKRHQALARLVQTLYKKQLKSKLDLDLIMVEVTNAEAALVKSRNDLTQQFAALNNAMGIVGGPRYRLEALPVEPAPASSLEPLVTEALQERPELLGGQAQLLARAELLKAAKALHYGSLTAVGVIGITKYGDIHDSGIPPDGVAPFWGVAATVRVPIFAGFKIQNQVKEAQHHHGEHEHELRNVANEVILQVVRAFLSQNSNAEQIVLENERLSFAQEALTLASGRYRLGLSPVVEVIQAMTAYFEAQARVIEAQYIYKTSEAALAYAIGKGYKNYELFAADGD